MLYIYLVALPDNPLHCTLCSADHRLMMVGCLVGVQGSKGTKVIILSLIYFNNFNLNVAASDTFRLLLAV